MAKKELGSATAAEATRESIARLGELVPRLSALPARLQAIHNVALHTEVFRATERLEALAVFLEHATESSPAVPSLTQP
jgi:hypothetical protein